jgi:hypothetical protein
VGRLTSHWRPARKRRAHGRDAPVVSRSAVRLGAPPGSAGAPDPPTVFGCARQWRSGVARGLRQRAVGRSRPCVEDLRGPSRRLAGTTADLQHGRALVDPGDLGKVGEEVIGIGRPHPVVELRNLIEQARGRTAILVRYSAILALFDSDSPVIPCDKTCPRTTGPTAGYACHRPPARGALSPVSISQVRTAASNSRRPGDPPLG